MVSCRNWFSHLWRHTSRSTVYPERSRSKSILSPLSEFNRLILVCIAVIHNNIPKKSNMQISRTYVRTESPTSVIWYVNFTQTYKHFEHTNCTLASVHASSGMLSHWWWYQSLHPEHWIISTSVNSGWRQWQNNLNTLETDTLPGLLLLRIGNIVICPLPKHSFRWRLIRDWSHPHSVGSSP